jgi:sporulation protein YlmC with PRC-barrel domain
MAFQAAAQLLPTNPPAMSQVNPARVVRGSTLIGRTVWDSSNQRLGVIRDIALDPSNGQVVYFILAADVPNVGSQLVVVPYDAMRVDLQGPALQPNIVLLIQPTLLRGAPRIENGRWEVLDQPQFFGQVRQFFRGAERVATRPGERIDRVAPGTERRERGAMGLQQPRPEEHGRGLQPGPEFRIQEPRTGERRTGEPRTGEPRTGELRTGEPHTGQPPRR